MFAHAGSAHLWINIASTVGVGTFLEIRNGFARIAIIWYTSAVVGTAFQALIASPPVRIVGSPNFFSGTEHDDRVANCLAQMTRRSSRGANRDCRASDPRGLRDSCFGAPSVGRAACVRLVSSLEVMAGRYVSSCAACVSVAMASIKGVAEGGGVPVTTEKNVCATTDDSLHVCHHAS